MIRYRELRHETGLSRLDESTAAWRLRSRRRKACDPTAAARRMERRTCARSWVPTRSKRPTRCPSRRMLGRLDRSARPSSHERRLFRLRPREAVSRSLRPQLDRRPYDDARTTGPIRDGPATNRRRVGSSNRRVDHASIRRLIWFQFQFFHQQRFLGLGRKEKGVRIHFLGSELRLESRSGVQVHVRRR